MVLDSDEVMVLIGLLAELPLYAYAMSPEEQELYDKVMTHDA